MRERRARICSSLYSLARAALAKVPEAQRVLERGGTELLAPLSAVEKATLAAILAKVVAHLDGDQ